MAPWLKTRSICCDVVCQAMNAAQDLIKEVLTNTCFILYFPTSVLQSLLHPFQVCVASFSPVLLWIKLALDILRISFASGAESLGKFPICLYGNEKILKACLDCISSFVELLDSSDGNGFLCLCFVIYMYSSSPGFPCLLSCHSTFLDFLHG